MLSFDVSLIDVTMLIAIIALAALYLTSHSDERPNRKSLVRKRARVSRTENESINASASDSESECSHFFGFLKTRDEKGQKGVPEECVGCARLVECLVGK